VWDSYARFRQVNTAIHNRKDTNMSYGGYGAGGGYNGGGGGYNNNYGQRGSSASYSSRSAGRAAPPKKHMLKLIILGDSG
jgi:hypothetical protein